MKFTKRQIAARLNTAKNSLTGAGKAAVAGAAGLAVLISNVMGSARSRATAVADAAWGKAPQKSEGGIVMRKSTLVALLVVLAAVAGALAALYFYVLRREKELDEYEQLLFSEDFDDEFSDEDEAELLDESE